MFSERLLDELLNAVRDPGTGNPLIGEADFKSSTFTGKANFDNSSFTGAANFEGVTFNSDARFQTAKFAGIAWFHRATFIGVAWFARARFSNTTWFREATFTDTAAFHQATFAGHVWFLGATSARDLWFSQSKFETASILGPLVCAGTLDLYGAVFDAPVTIEAATIILMCQRTRWGSTAALRLRYASVDLSDAVLEYPVSLMTRPDPFVKDAGTPLEEAIMAGAESGVRVVSLHGVDTAHLALSDVDLSMCVFTGTVHLDQLRLEGRVPFAPVPPGTHRRGWRLVRFSPRRTLAEEQHWRAAQPSAVPGWASASAGDAVVGPARLAPVYRSLRKAFEDGKNEPGAADFYYGEMEMRRADKEEPRAERWLLAAYWALSGYGLRATRALGWLIAAMAITIGVMMLWGLPAHDPKPVSTGTLSGQHITLTTETPDPVNPTGPLHERVSTDRFEKSLRVVVNSVIFRSSGQDLTTTGTYTEMASRLAEPVLLGLAILAIRGRVKR
ncbi:pentapeptide repeat-containing protein [Streptomyces sp. NPDC057496]|uniref:pentapeptide repeat-containing protein n=1 Tax=Streptomyces sp. NPDC057496 TaxID=3346149 RepID=UPI0036C32B89